MFTPAAIGIKPCQRCWIVRKIFKFLLECTNNYGKLYLTLCVGLSHAQSCLLILKMFIQTQFYMTICNSLLSNNINCCWMWFMNSNGGNQVRTGTYYRNTSLVTAFDICFKNLTAFDICFKNCFNWYRWSQTTTHYLLKH
jgi:hypothetical protein